MQWLLSKIRICPTVGVITFASMANLLKDQTSRLLAKAGIEINGTKPWDITVHDERLYRRVFLQGSLGLGEAYMDGWWEVPELDLFFTRILEARLDQHQPDWTKFLSRVTHFFFNHQSRGRAFQVGEEHYDVGNDIYRAMLDQRLTYTCGYWQEAATLDEAQEAKLDLICRKLRLQPGQHILDIGCGWGSFMQYAAERYKVRMTGVTVSKEQIALGQKRCAGLPVTFLLQDYRDITGQYDHIVSVGMFEHVGYKNYRTFMEVAERSLKNEGLFLLHTIGHNEPTVDIDPWIDRYIFPNGMMPGFRQLAAAFENLFVMEDWHNFGADYDRTLMAWHANFSRSWPQLQKKYGERFFRMWQYYLLMSAASFRARRNQLWQVVFSKQGVAGGYQSVR